MILERKLVHPGTLVLTDGSLHAPQVSLQSHQSLQKAAELLVVNSFCRLFKRKESNHLSCSGLRALIPLLLSHSWTVPKVRANLMDTGRWDYGVTEEIKESLRKCLKCSVRTRFLPDMSFWREQRECWWELLLGTLALLSHLWRSCQAFLVVSGVCTSRLSSLPYEHL